MGKEVLTNKEHTNMNRGLHVLLKNLSQ